MKLLNAYAKVIKKHMPTILLYMLVLYSIIMVTIFQVKDNHTYEDDKITAALINEDTDNAFTRGLKEYLGERVKLVDEELPEGQIRSVLFYRTVDYVVEIPEGFYEKLNSEERNAVLNKYTASDSYAEAVVDLTLKEYCNWWLAYRESYPEMTEQEIYTKVVTTLKTESGLTFYNQLKISEKQRTMHYFFDYASYSIMGIIGMGVVTALLSVSRSGVYNRILVSPVTKAQAEIELLILNIGYAVLIWALHILAAMSLFEESFYTSNGIFLCINAFALAMASVGLSYLLRCFVNSRNTAGVFINLVVIGMCFISGTFIPQYLLAQTIRSAAVFTPVYWYIQANDLINETGMLSASSVSGLIRAFGTQFVFAVMFFCAALFITKQREEVRIGG
ncbi:MAG: ABC transporter permease [Lachnospiraceae bacterium]